MTPQEIAREAADTLISTPLPTMSQFLTMEACMEARRKAIAALILTAAAKMVRDAKAVEEMERLIRVADAIADEANIGWGDGAIRDARTALQSLRALTEHKP